MTPRQREQARRRDPGHQHSIEVAKGAFWLSAAAGAVALLAAPGQGAGFWGGRATLFFLRWAVLQAAFAGCFAVGTMIADGRKGVGRWAIPAALIGLVVVLLYGPIVWAQR